MLNSNKGDFKTIITNDRHYYKPIQARKNNISPEGYIRTQQTRGHEYWQLFDEHFAEGLHYMVILGHSVQKGFH